MLEKILRILRRAFTLTETSDVRAVVIAGDIYTAVVGFELASSASGIMAITTPADEDLLFEYASHIALGATIAVYAGPTITPATGTTADLRNRNLQIGDSLTDILIDPTVTNNGVLIDSTKYGSGIKAGAETESSWFLLPRSTALMIKITSHAAANNIATRINVQKVNA
jgi:hypothetical protein